jgi:hypothetical protein
MYQSISFQPVSSLTRNVPGVLLHSSQTTSSPRRTMNTWIPPDISVADSVSSSTRYGGGTRIAWCPYCYVDNDAALMRGWIQGYPVKFGTVHQTRTFDAASVASAPLVYDGRFSACMSAHGRLLVQARVTLREKVERLVGMLDRRIVGRRHFPRLSAGMHDEPAVDELVRSVSNHPRITNIWIGESELNFPEAYGEELEMLGPLKVGRGYRFSFSYSVTDIEILADLTALAR